MERIERLEAIEAIRALKARYFRLIDTKQWDELAKIFAAELRIVTPEGKVWLEGGQAYADSLEFGLSSATSCHQGLSGEIDVIDAENAKAIWAMQDIIQWEECHPREGWKSIVGRGHYHETYRKQGGLWRIATLSLTRISLDITWPQGHLAA